MFAAIATCPDIIFVVSQLFLYNSNLCQRHLAAAKHVLRYLKETINLGIVYKKQSTSKSPRGFWSNEIELFDVDWGRNLDSRRFIIDFVVLLNDAIIAWKSCKQSMIALSTMKAEYMALTNAAKEIKWIRQLFDELNYDIVPRSSTILRTDN